MEITFEVREGRGAFQYSEGYDETVQELDDFLDQRDSGRIDPDQYLTKLQDLVARHPDFIDGFAHIGYALFDQGKSDRALEACLRGFALGEEAIPSGFHGMIEWGHLENRPFLRSAHGIVICHLRSGQNQKALLMMEKMLAWNPIDNQGIRYIIGPEYLRAGKVDRARAVFEGEAAYYPPYRYELALLLLRTGQYVAAATSLRHGFIENGYIAEILSGMPNPLPLTIWHGSNFAEPELARDYVSRYGDLWRRIPHAIAFLRWLHTHPKIMAERATVLECKEALLWEYDIGRRQLILAREEAAKARIDDGLSAEIVVDRTDRHGRPVSPWFNSATQFRPR